jgi:protein SCO1/2
MVYYIRATIMVWLMLIAACRRAPEPAPSVSPASQSTNRRSFQAKGIIQAVRPAQMEVVIKHEAIPDYMPAMTMPFDVKDPKLLTGLEPGQPVSFRLTVTDTEGWIDQIQSLGSATNIPSAIPRMHPVREVPALSQGDLLPEYHFINQFGKPLSTTQFKGQALAITFLFTRCPFPTFCPRMANQFAEAQQKLLAMTNGPVNWHLLTISFDPEFDTAAVLKAYAQSHHYDPEHWSFATGELDDIAAMGEHFGLAFWHDETGSITHNLRTIVVDSGGRVMKIFQGSDWTSDELVTELRKGCATN